MESKSILIMAGGTGGHIFPGLALAKEMQARGHKVTWLGTKAGMESTLVPKENIDIHYISVKGVRGKGIKALFLAPWNIVSSVMSASKVIASVKPNVVVGLGGFVAGPGGVAAKLKCKPLVIHEQNAVAGTTNKLLAKIADKVLTAFPCGLTREICIGNPVRKEISELPSPEQRMKSRTASTNVLIIGGSRGALAVNELVPQAFALLQAAGESNIWHQAGADKVDATVKQYESVKVAARVEAFIDNMAEALAWADVVICRAGALTVSELAMVGLGAVLIPYPYAIDDHQTENAKYLADKGAAIVRQQKDLSAESLANLLKEFIFDRAKLLNMASQAKLLAKPNAVNDFADYCEGVAHV